jgi:hypothetical protein
MGLIACALVASACEDCGGPDVPPRIACEANAECPGVELCINGFCEDPAGISCASDDECPAGLICLENGRCRADTECQVDADCCADATNCTSICEEFQCIGTECDVGESEDCFVGCHRGARECDNGNWGLCDAAPVGPEECGDGIDNDCNGVDDDGCPVCEPGETRACDAPCGGAGEGTQTCLGDGTFGACDTVDGCACTPGVDTVRTIACGNCGFRDSSCGADGVWADDDACQSEGECAAGDVEALDCGNCGQQQRTCDGSCSWGEFGACTVPNDACEPGSVVLEACGTCGAATRTCGADCTLGAPSACDEGAGCSDGDQQTQPCGNCGERVATCDDTCTFGAFGACLNEGVCSPGEVQTEACGNCGTRSRICGDGCTFGVFGPCEEEGECTPGEEVDEDCGPASEEGICQRGTRTKVCDDDCSFSDFGGCVGAVFPSNDVCGNGVDENCDGSDFQILDQFEINDSCGTARSLGNDPNVTIQPTYDSVDDAADYFFFHGIDNTGITAEHVRASLRNIPAGMDLDLFIYKGFDNCVNDVALDSSVALDNADEDVDFVEAQPGDDTADYYVKVAFFFTPSCTLPYSLTVNGLN